MPIDWHSVYSSTVAEVGHDKDTQELHVIWQRGKRTHSIYEGVSRAEFDSLSTDFSVGKAIHQRVKGVYPHRYAND